MKIRTDFVTNSSSSSFVLEISFELTDGSYVNYRGVGSCGEGAHGDFYELEMRVSPRQLGTAGSIQELVDLLKTGVTETGYTDVKALRIMDEQNPDTQRKTAEAKNNGWAIGSSFDAAADFIRRVEQIPDMASVKSVRVSGNESNYRKYFRTYEYDRTSDVYTKAVQGFEFEKNGGSGGDLVFSDDALAVDPRTLETVEYTTDINYLIFKNRRFVTTGFTDAENARIERSILSRGGTVGTQVGPQTYCLIVNEKFGRTTEKYKRAAAYNKGSDLSFSVLGEYVVSHPPRTGTDRIRIINTDMLRRFLNLKEGAPLDPAKPITFAFSADPNFLNFRNRHFVVAGFPKPEKQKIERQLEERGGIADSEMSNAVYCLIVNKHGGQMTGEYEEAIKKKACYIISGETLQKYLELPEGTLLDPSQPPYITKEEGLLNSVRLTDVSAAVTRLDLSGTKISCADGMALCSCTHLEKLIIPTDNLLPDIFAFTEIDELCFTVPALHLRKSHFRDRPLPRVRMPLALLGECETTESKQAIIDSFLNVWASGGSFEEDLQAGYDDYLRSQRKKYIGNDTALRYMAARGLLPEKEARSLAQAARDAEMDELAALLDKGAETAAAAPKKEKSTTAAEDKLWATKKLPDGSLRLRLYKGLSVDVVVPAQLKGLPVTEVENVVFLTKDKSLTEEQKEARKQIRSVTVSEGIKKWGVDNNGNTYNSTNMFDCCPNLETLVFPESLKEICSLTGIGPNVTLHLPNAYYSLKNAFRGTLYKTITVPEGVISIGSFAFAADGFSENKRLTCIALPQGLQKIGDWAFYKCTELKEIALPAGLREIGPNAFSNCTKIESVEIPSSVSVIEECAFGWCKNLHSLKINEGVLSIGSEAFWYCDALETVLLPEGLEEIGEKAFAYCDLLKNVTIPSSVRSIGKDAFSSYNNSAVVIYAKAGSYAEKYAKENGLRFQTI